jgi:hypothetical protein
LIPAGAVNKAKIFRGVSWRKEITEGGLRGTSRKVAGGKKMNR